MLAANTVHNDVWQNFLDLVKQQTSQEEFTKWFLPIVPLEFDGTNLRLRVPNASYVYQIEKNYLPFVKPTLPGYTASRHGFITPYPNPMHRHRLP